MEPVSTHRFRAADAVELTFREFGVGRPVLLVHGFMTPATPTWIDSGIAARLASDGRRVIMPDLRGHGDSVPQSDAYPADALTSDLLSLVTHLRLTDYDLVGYSLGGRIVARALALGALPRRAVIGGTGLDPIVHAAGRGGNYRRILSNLGTFEPGTPEAQFEGYLKQVNADPVALMRVFDTFVDTPVEALGAVDVPALVIAGERDTSRGSVGDLAAAIPHAELRIVPGDHYGALWAPQFIDAVCSFLADGSA
jgi:pimeloyl-ACP methyl ester carboxylesterase